jgi:hypothetical protein
MKFCTIFDSFYGWKRHHLVASLSCILNALSNCTGRTEEFTRQVGMSIWLRSKSGSRLSVSMPISRALLADKLTPCQDLLFERLQMNYDLSKIKAIAGAAQVGLEYFVRRKSTAW